MRFAINQSAYPLPDSVQDLTFFKTSHWGKKCLEDRKNCFGILEKDKIVMHKWITQGGFPQPEVHYSAYVNDTSIDELRRIWSANPDRFLVLKLSHLQCGWGVRILPPYDTVTEQDIEEIWAWCQKGFGSCLCCNLDSEHQTFRASLEDRTVLYRSIQPGMLIQDFFHGSQSAGFSLPHEVQVLVIGGDISPFQDAHIVNPQVRELAQDVARYLGADYVRVDIFLDECQQNLVIGEISLSPNMGVRDAAELAQIENRLSSVNQLPSREFPGLQALCEHSPIRDYPLANYCYDLDVSSQKWRIIVKRESTRLLKGSGIHLNGQSRFHFSDRKMKLLDNPGVRFLYRDVVVPIKTIRHRKRRDNCHRRNRV